MAKDNTMKDEAGNISTIFVPTEKEIAARTKSYKYLQTMRELKDKPMPHFSGPDGDRSWLALIDDSEAILNGYTRSREEQGKEAWQSNMMDNISRVKMRATVAGIALKVPEMNTSATNKEGIKSSIRAEVIKNIVRQSFNEGNPTMSAFQEAWHMVGHGFVVEYEGYKTGGAMRERVVSFDSVTGEVTTKKEYVKMDGKPISILLNAQEFFWWTFGVRDVQDQQRVAWVQHYSKGEIELEFSKFKNYKFIKDKAEASRLQVQNSLFSSEWGGRVQSENDYEVFRMYDKERDLYEVWINGVPLIQCPLLWGDKEKVYPFAKQVGEPYANTNFFVGMPFGQIMEAYQDQKNTVQNTLADKLYRSMKKPILYGLNGKDLFDIQDQFVDEDNKFYVPDINQVKPFPYEGINQGELAYLALIDRNIESVSVDRAQQGQTGGQQITARASIIADQRAKEIKTVLYNNLEDLWLQKTRLRTQIVITHFLEDKAIQKEVGSQIIEVKDYTFGDNTRGILAIHIAKTPKQQLSQNEVEARAQAMEKQGIAYKLISVTADWLDDWKYDFSIVPQSFHQQEQALKEDSFNSEVQWLAMLNPQLLASNLDKYTAEKLAFRGKNIDDLNPPAQAQPQSGQTTQPNQPNQSQPKQPTPGQPETSVLGLQPQNG